MSDDCPSDGGNTTALELACKRIRPVGRLSNRTAAVGTRFGVPLHETEVTVIPPTRIRVGPGRIVLLLGPSGSGKSSALAAIAERFAGAVMVHRVAFATGAAVIDGVARGADFSDAVSVLTSCGLGEAPLWVRPFDALSDGERFRARLARAVSLHARAGRTAPLLCDEFCSGLHRRVAQAISFCMRKIVSRLNLSVVVASANEDLVRDLQPDTTVHLSGAGRCEVEERVVRKNAAFSRGRRIRIERGCKRDYDAFASMHYRVTDELGFVDKVFVMRDGGDGPLVGVVVYAHAPLELALRNRATDGFFSRNAKRVNHSLRILRRLVIHPDIRGCGMGQHLVRKTLPLVGTPYVECLATMGAFNPVFERAGMARIGQYAVSQQRRAALEHLRAIGIDPGSQTFAAKVAKDRRVREIVSKTVYDWYAATTAGGERRVERQSPELLAQTFRGLIGSEPVYYLWRKAKRTRAHRSRT